MIENPSQTTSAPEAPLAPRRTRLQESWRLLKKNKLAMAGFLIFVLFFLISLAGVWLTSGTKPVIDPSLVRLPEKLRPPLSTPTTNVLRPAEIPAMGIYLFGTDELGRDVFARMLQGASVSLFVGFVAVGISVLVGILMGGLSGYYGERLVRMHHVLASSFVLVGGGFLASGNLTVGTILCFIAIGLTALSRTKTLHQHPRIRFLFAGAFSVDTLIMRFVDIMLCFPSFFLILTVVALLPPSIWNIMIVIGLTSWEGTARFVRAEFLSLREQDFVTAARALGVNDLRIIFRHMIPNAIAPVLVSATIGIAGAILTEAGLSFLGFGVPPPDATWGNILSDGKRFIFDAPWLTFVPGFAILIVVLSFNLFGEGLRDILNPKLRERY